MKQLVFLLFIFLNSVSADELCSKTSCYPKTILKADLQFHLVGKSDFTYLFMDIYSVALYVDQANFTGDVLNPKVAKFLHFKYHRKIEKKRIVDGAVDTLQKNPNFNYEKFKVEAQQINQYYEDVDDQSEYYLTYLPDKGLTLSNNKQNLSTIKDPEFAKYYLGIWLSEYPLSKRVREQLLNSKF